MYHVRFYYFMVKHFYIRRKSKPRSVFEVQNYATRAPFMETDFNLHKSNSTYFIDLDMSRTNLLMHVFKDFFLKYKDAEVPDAGWPYCPVGSVASVFRKELSPYELYNVKSRVLGWDQKWLFVVSRFEKSDKKSTLCAVCLTKYVFKMKRKTVPPATVIKFCNLSSQEAMEEGQKGYELAKAFLEIEALEEKTF
jgi:Thioesterase-like superfamily